MQINSKLYRVSSKGKITEWSVSANGPAYTITTGFVDGKKQSFTTEVTNQRNSSSLEEQAISEATSAWNLKRKTMYPTIEEACSAKQDNSLSLGGYNPMLAAVFDPKKPGFSLTECFIQPKLDGKRCIARKVDGDVTLYARSGAVQSTTPHLNEQLSELMLDGEIWDGEIYKHGMELEDILSLTQATKHTKDTSKLQYHVYDFPRIGDLLEASPFGTRLDAFRDRFFGESMPHNNVGVVDTHRVNSLAKIVEIHAELVEDYNYEGAILRNRLAPYQNKRTKDLLKFKTFQDAEFEIIGVNEGKGKLKDHAGTFTCKMPDGRTFDAKLKGETSNLIRYLDHPEEAIGKMLNVEFFAYTKYGIPRFPVGRYLRDKGDM